MQETMLAKEGKCLAEGVKLSSIADPGIKRNHHGLDNLILLLREIEYQNSFGKIWWSWVLSEWFMKSATRGRK
jgi:hypothetical protein